jgi:hypothetical protein
MKKTVIFFILLFAATFGSYAQDYREVVYLKDGNIVKGFILEQVPNDYLKIKTATGRVYTIEMYEVEKIIKERVNTKTERVNTRTQDSRRENTSRYGYDNRYGNSRSSGNRSGYLSDHDDYDDYYAPRNKNSFGVKIGGTLANMALDDSKSKIGFSGGVFGEFRFNSFAIQPELLFSMQGAKEDSEEDVSSKIDMNYLNIPIMAKSYVFEGFSLEIGPQLGLLLSAKAKSKIEGVKASIDVKEYVNDIDFSLNIGASYHNPLIPVGFYTRYSLGLTNIMKDLDPGDEGGKNRVFQLGAFMQF